jgi:hypothetical protein
MLFNFWKTDDADKASTPEVEVAADAAASIRPDDCAEMRILRDFAKQRDAARARVIAIEDEVERLEMVVREGAKVAATLQSDIAADGAVGIAAIVSGSAQPNGAMTALIAIELSARAAQARLPVAQAELAQAKVARERAEVETMRAGRNLMMIEAGKIGAEYREHFNALARLHDQMLGISYGMPPTETLGQEIHNSAVGFEIPAFNMGGAYSVTMRHIPDERAVAGEMRRWTAAREAVIENPDADFRAILDGPTAEPPPSSLPPGMTMSTRETTHVDAGTPIDVFGLPWSPLAA